MPATAKSNKYNRPLPQPPGIDTTDPKTMSAAKGVATRKNNQFKKFVATKLPLFADELHAGYETMTAEKVIERRVEFRAGFRQWKREFNELQKRQIRKSRAAVLEIVTDAAEFRKLIRHVVRLRGGDRSMRWTRTLELVKKRKNTPLSQNTDMVLAWLQQEAAPVTHFEIFEKRGDGLRPEQILNALIELSTYAYVSMVDVVELPERYKNFDGWNVQTAWTWESVKNQ